MTSGTQSPSRVYLAGLFLCAATMSCNTSSDGGGARPTNQEDIRYIWPDEGTERESARIEGAEGLIGPYQTTLVATLCANLSACINEIDVATCVATARDYWNHRDTGDAARVLQRSPERWESASLSVATAIDCLSSASDCSQMQSCISKEGACGMCQGEDAILCPEAGAPLGFRINCAAVGLECVEGNAGASVSCGSGSCNLNAASCTSQQLSTCEDGIAKTIECESGGLQCESNGLDDAWCQGTAGPCDSETEAAHCSGQTARNCVGGGWSERNCDFVGSENSHRCALSTTPQLEAKCIVDGGCDPEAFTETCISGKIAICPYGQPIEIDCEALGHLGCALEPSAGCRN